MWTHDFKEITLIQTKMGKSCRYFFLEKSKKFVRSKETRKAVEL